MSREEVAALAKAFALVNGHSHPEDYAAAVADAYVEPEAAKPEDESHVTE